MLVGELVEMILQNLHGVLDRRGLLAMPYLQKQTFTKVPGSDSRRIKLLNYLEHVENLFLISLHIGTERQVIDDTVNASAQIAVIVEAADKKRCHGILMLGEITVSELFLKTLGKTFLY